MKYPNSKSKIYGVWANMKERCDNSNYKSYYLYGGRGIEYEPKWKSFHGFCDDMLPGYKEGLTLDRTNNNGNYERNNCRWITNLEQQNNRRDNNYVTYNGRTQSIADWARELGLKHKTLWCRIMVYDWPLDKALTSELYVSNQFNRRRVA